MSSCVSAQLSAFISRQQHVTAVNQKMCVRPAKRGGLHNTALMSFASSSVTLIPFLLNWTGKTRRRSSAWLIWIRCNLFSATPVNMFILLEPFRLDPVFWMGAQAAGVGAGHLKEAEMEKNKNTSAKGVNTAATGRDIQIRTLVCEWMRCDKTPWKKALFHPCLPHNQIRENYY